MMRLVLRATVQILTAQRAFSYRRFVTFSTQCHGAAEQRKRPDVGILSPWPRSRPSGLSTHHGVRQKRAAGCLHGPYKHSVEPDITADAGCQKCRSARSQSPMVKTGRGRSEMQQSAKAQPCVCTDIHELSVNRKRRAAVAPAELDLPTERYAWPKRFRKHSHQRSYLTTWLNGHPAPPIVPFAGSPPWILPVSWRKSWRLCTLSMEMPSR